MCYDAFYVAFKLSLSNYPTIITLVPGTLRRECSRTRDINNLKLLHTPVSAAVVCCVQYLSYLLQVPGADWEDDLWCGRVELMHSSSRRSNQGNRTSCRYLSEWPF